ncbi:unnamed protein product [Effrenium voratum]|uniref:Protein TIC 20 n=1 Tax=Effrenium voratum TaxID=2562239 RepID=A0AA36I0R6_9DINO|nr:unnamed protein product [Effrenium voratum]
MRQSSASDRLLHDSLSREVKKMQSGRRPADVSRPTRPVPRPARAARPAGGAPVASRFFGAMFFLPPLVLAVPYGLQLFQRSRMLRDMVLKPLLPLVLAFHSSRAANFLCIVVLYGLVGKNKSLHPFTRSIGRQASTLMMVQFPANFILQFFGAPGPISNLVQASIFLYFVYCVIFGALGSLRGQVADLPGIGAGTPSFQRGQSGPTSFRPGG